MSFFFYEAIICGIISLRDVATVLQKSIVVILESKIFDFLPRTVSFAFETRAEFLLVTVDLLEKLNDLFKVFRERIGHLVKLDLQPLELSFVVRLTDDCAVMLGNDMVALLLVASLVNSDLHNF